MKVLIVASRYYPNILGGGEISTQILAEALGGRGHQTIVVTLSPQQRYDCADLNDVRILYLPLRNIYPIRTGAKQRSALARAVWHALDSYNPFMAASLGRILDRERPDVVNTHSLDGFSASVWRAVKDRRLPLVHTLRSHYLLCANASMYRNEQNCSKPCAVCRVYNRPRRRASALVDVVTGISRYILDIHDRHGCFRGAERMVVYNASGVEAEPEAPVRNSNEKLRFGYIGRLHPTKGLELLLRSFLKLPKGKGELLIAGRGTPSFEQKLKRMSRGHPGVCWIGFVPPAELLEQVDILVVPSVWREPGGRVVLESMAHHVPVIGSRRGGIPEQMGEGTGWVFDPDEAGSLTRAMLQAIKSNGELPVMRKRASERARQFSSETMLNGYLRAYSRAIDKNEKDTKAR